jgi:hypothetical protein
MTSKTEKIQYYAPDLSYALNIGEIADMHVVNENGKQILRIEYVKKQEYKTVKTQKKPAKQKPVQEFREPRRAPPVLDTDVRSRDVPAMQPPSLGSKIIDAGKTFLTKPMKRPDQW